MTQKLLKMKDEGWAIAHYWCEKLKVSVGSDKVRKKRLGEFISEALQFYNAYLLRKEKREAKKDEE